MRAHTRTAMPRSFRFRSSQDTFLRLIVLAAGLALAHPAWAEIFKCVGPDGSVIYTSDERQCPGARPHQPKGVVQTVPGRLGSSSQPAASVEKSGGGASTSGVADGLETMWRKKRSRAEEEYRQVESIVRRLEPVMSDCNRGGKWSTKDNAGLKQSISCQEIGAHLQKAQAREQQLRTYLDGGLEEECRRAGCLPGWVR